MSTVKLYKRTSVDFALFEKFAWFLVESQYQPGEKIYKDDFYRDLGTKFLGGEKELNFLSSKSVANLFVATEDYAEIEEERLRLFCELFSKVYSTLSSDDKIKYRDLEESFINWRNKIYYDQRWILFLTEDYSKKKPFINLAENMNTPNIVNLFQLQANYYHNFLSDDNFYESELYLNWYNTISSRNYNKSNELNLNLVEATLKTRRIDVYSVSESTILLERLMLSNISDKTPVALKSGFHYADNGFQHLSSLMNYYPNKEIILISEIRASKNNEASACSYIFDMCSFREGASDLVYGYFFKMDQYKNLIINPAVAVFRHLVDRDHRKVDMSSLRPSPNEFDVKDDQVPFKVRAFLKEKEKDYSDQIFDSYFLQKAFLFFMHDAYNQWKRNHLFFISEKSWDLDSPPDEI